MEIQFEQLGLSKGEARVYLALFDLKEGTKYTIAKEAGVSASKVYEILDKPTKKGLAPTILRNHVKHFYPANPSQLKEYVEDKKRQLNKEEEFVNHLVPILTAKLSSPEQKTKVELYEGINGMKTILSIIEQEFDPEHEWLAMGIRSGKNSAFNNLVIRFHQARAEKDVAARMLFTDEGSEFYGTLKKMNKTRLYFYNQRRHSPIIQGVLQWALENRVRKRELKKKGKSYLGRVTSVCSL